MKMMRIVMLAGFLLPWRIAIGINFQANPAGTVPPLSVDAGSGQQLCQAGDTVLLSATPDGPVFSVLWEPATGLSDPASLQTLAFPDTTTTYTVRVRGFSNENLLTNGDFSLGDVGFTTDYRGGGFGFQGPLSGTNRYAVDNRPRDQNRNFNDCRDHTTGDGNMMMFNGAESASRIWCQQVPVTPNTRYGFSGWMLSLVNNNVANLQVSINGENIDFPFIAPDTDCTWEQFSVTWESGNASIADICITNLTTTSSGNDFAIDDLYFGPVVEASDQVTIEVSELDASWEAPTIFCENDAAVPLDAWLLATATRGGTWTIDGQPATAFDPAILGTGNFTVRYEVVDGACQVDQERSLSIRAVPNAGSSTAPLRLCNAVDTTIRLVTLVNNANPGGSWTEISATPTTGNAFDQAQGSLRTGGLAPGTYTFRYFLDAPLPCPPDEVTVTIILSASPVADAGDDQSIDCTFTEAELGGAATSQGPNLGYEWRGPGNALIGGAPIITVDQEGLYRLTVIDGSTGCRSTDEVTVVSNITTPTAELLIQEESCAGDDDGAILVSNTSGGTDPYLYGLNGGALGPKNQFEGLEPGRYEITIEDANGCTATLEGIIEPAPQLTAMLDANQPGDPAIIGLGDSLLLEALINVPDDRIASIEWTPAIEGCNNCRTTYVRPLKNTSYQILITDINGCQTEASAAVRVERRENIFIPNAFSPNNDGVNDVLMVYSGNEVEVVRSFRIINRWGSLVYNAENFKPNDPAYGWDGFVSGQRERSGVYIYLAELVLVDGTSLLISGDVALVD